MTKTNLLIFIIGCVIIIIGCLTVLPTLKKNNHKLSIPRFVTIKSNRVNARTGPSIKCPIKWVFIKKGEPVEITAEYEQWRQVRDIQGEGGWIHVSVLSGKRSVIVIDTETVELLSAPKENSKVIAKISPSVRCQFNKCTGNFCQVRCQNYKGWLPKTALWGVYQHEH